MLVVRWFSPASPFEFQAAGDQFTVADVLALLVMFAPEDVKAGASSIACPAIVSEVGQTRIA